MLKMIISKEQADTFAMYILNNDIISFCIDNYKEFNKFQLDGQEAYIFTDEELLQYERELMELWI